MDLFEASRIFFFYLGTHRKPQKEAEGTSTNSEHDLSLSGLLEILWELINKSCQHTLKHGELQTEIRDVSLRIYIMTVA